MFIMMIPFYMMIISGTLITLSSTSWFAAWVGLEVNLMAFIPMIYSLNKMTTETMIKYFLIQAMASMFILFSAMMILMKISNFNLSSFLNLNPMILNLALLTKMGAAPFHFWFPAVSEGMSWKPLIMLMTWQKLAPLSLMILNKMNSLLLMISILSATIGALGGLNQMSLKKILTYSSISHMGWMIILLTSSPYNTMMYFLFYSFLSISILYFLMKLNINFLSQMLTLGTMNMMLFLLPLSLLSLGGLPPLLGFFPKWMALKIIMNMNYIVFSIILVSLGIISLYYYLRITYAIFMLNTASNKSNTPLNTPIYMYMYILPSMMMLPFMLLTLCLFN